MNENYFNGAKVTPADKKFVEQHLSKVIENLEKSEANWKSEVRNPFSGESIEANPLEKSIVLFVQELSYNEFSPAVLAKYGISQGSAVQKFDRARYLLLKINQSMYSAILD